MRAGRWGRPMPDVAANPFTAELLARLSERRADDAAALAPFVDGWDRLESLVIDVYRAGRADRAAEAAWTALRAPLAAAYDGVAAPLAAHWPRVRAAGRPCAADPFRALLDPPAAAAFVDNRTAMQTLPAAREALNRLLVALAEDNG